MFTTNPVLLVLQCETKGLSRSIGDFAMAASLGAWRSLVARLTPLGAG